MPPEEKERIQRLIVIYDARPPFNEEKTREEIKYFQETVNVSKGKEKLPRVITQLRILSILCALASLDTIFGSWIIRVGMGVEDIRLTCGWSNGEHNDKEN